MPPKVLRRCDVCGNFHVSYVIEDPQQGKLHLCYQCWKARQAPPAAEPPLAAREPIVPRTRPKRPH